MVKGDEASHAVDVNADAVVNAILRYVLCVCIHDHSSALADHAPYKGRAPAADQLPDNAAPQHVVLTDCEFTTALTQIVSLYIDHWPAVGDAGKLVL